MIRDHRAPEPPPIFSTFHYGWDIISGSVTDSYVYDSWGNILSTSGSTTNEFKYIGKMGYYFDGDTGYNFLRARYYNPIFGRFLSQDPLGFYNSMNPYSYGLNIPGQEVEKGTFNFLPAQTT